MSEQQLFDLKFKNNRNGAEATVAQSMTREEALKLLEDHIEPGIYCGIRFKKSAVSRWVSLDVDGKVRAQIDIVKAESTPLMRQQTS